MADYSKTIEEIRRNNERLEEVERKTPEEKKKVKNQQKMSLLRDKVISYLLKTIKEYQLLEKKVEEIYLMEDKYGHQEIEVYNHNVFGWTRPGEYCKKSSISFSKVFGGSTIKEIYEAFGLEEDMNKTEVADGFFTIVLQGSNPYIGDYASTDFYDSYVEIFLRFHIRY